MSEQLVSIIDLISKRISAGSFRTRVEISHGVVQRVLHDLGWPVFDIHVVAPEFSIGSRTVDYALCHPPYEPTVIVDVREPERVDRKVETQVLEFCHFQDVPIAVLTDGRIWDFFFPVGKGGYEEQRVERFDLVEDENTHSARILVNYLQYDRVTAGRARERAEKDYRVARFQRDAMVKYAPVWKKLLKEPDPLLLELFSEEVQNTTGVMPDPDLAAAFIRSQMKSGPLSLDYPPKSSTTNKRETTVVRTSPSKPKGLATADVPRLTFRGQTETFSSGAEVLCSVFTKLATMDPGFCRRYSEQHRGRVRLYVARRRDLLFPGHPQLERQSCKLPGGWWLATHCSTEEKLRRMRQACELMGLNFGSDLEVHIPIGSRV